MRVFVLSTGRCGSTTFAEAFTAADNYTSGHESRTRCHPGERFDYPDQHIEADNRLSWFLGELDRRFGDEAHYVHLWRDPEDVAESYVARWPATRRHHDSGIIGSFSHGMFRRRSWPVGDRLDLGRCYANTVNANIDLFLRGRPRVSHARLETLAEDVEEIWHAIGATGDLDAAIATASRPHNIRPVRPGPFVRYPRAITRRIREANGERQVARSISVRE